MNYACQNFVQRLRVWGHGEEGKQGFIWAQNGGGGHWRKSWTNGTPWWPKGVGARGGYAVYIVTELVFEGNAIYPSWRSRNPSYNYTVIWHSVQCSCPCGSCYSSTLSILTSLHTQISATTPHCSLAHIMLPLTHTPVHANCNTYIPLSVGELPSVIKR